MPKDVFIRSKPHIMAARHHLFLAGVSMTSIDQLFNGVPIQDQNDRYIITRVAHSALKDNRSSTWMRMQQVHTTFSELLDEDLRMGMIERLQNPLTWTLDDRKLIAMIAADAVNSGRFTPDR